MRYECKKKACIWKLVEYLKESQHRKAVKILAVKLGMDVVTVKDEERGVDIFSDCF